MAAMHMIEPKSLEETMMFKGDEDSLESLFDKPESFASVRHMEVDALSKGGKSNSGKGKSVTCWVPRHMSRDCFYKKGKSKGKEANRSGTNCGDAHFSRHLHIQHR